MNDETPTTYKIAVSRYALDRKIPVGHEFWSTFNASFDNLELDTEHIVDAIYKGQSITTWHSNHWRHSKNYLCGQYLGLDFDKGDSSSRLDTLAKDPFIAKYAAFLYTTLSHTPDCPRARAIFLLDQPIVQAKNYTLAATALLWVFHTADRACKDSVRFFYGSPHCEFEYINSVLPLAVVKKLIQDYEETGIEHKHKALQKDYAAPASQQEVADALKHIPPWGIDYPDWLAVLMGIHSEFGEAGYLLAENWADGKPGEVERKWKSFDQTGNDAGQVTIGTVFALAKQHGWVRQGALA